MDLCAGGEANQVQNDKLISTGYEAGATVVIRQRVHHRLEFWSVHSMFICDFSTGTRTFVSGD
jgi:hypothetical protein